MFLVQHLLLMSCSLDSTGISVLSHFYSIVSNEVCAFKRSSGVEHKGN